MSAKHWLIVLFVVLVSGPLHAGEPTVTVTTPMTPPTWALLEREVIRAGEAACKEFFARYFDERGWLLCVERWGGDDGPDDAIENCTNWPILHALGASNDVLAMYKKAWEGHLRQYTLARTRDVPFARDGMYFKEFPVMFDWLHHAEGLTVFTMQGLAEPRDERLLQRVRRYAGFYLNEDPGAPNYDARHKIIRSLFNGSRGPLLRKATALDWAGDPIEVKNRFRPGHGENSYEEMLAHFKDYNDIVGDHPQNLQATSLVLYAYLLTGEKKYRDWILEYVDAWRERMKQNNGIIPTNIGLDGKIGGEVGGKWYGGVYGWSFSVEVPQTGKLAHRNSHHLGLSGFGNAYLLTGDDSYLDPWRKMIDLINAQAKKNSNNEMTYPHMYGDKGWYEYTTEPYSHGAEELWYWTMSEADRKRLPLKGWTGYLHGKEPNWPEQALRADLDTIRRRVRDMRADNSTPDTRLADDSMKFNPVLSTSLVPLMLGGLPTSNRSLVLHCRVRYFDPENRRSGLPEDVAAIVETMTADQTEVVLVNLNQLKPRTVVIQGGAYGEHRITTLQHGDKKVSIDATTVVVKLEPGAGARLVLGMKRFAQAPTLQMPWER